MLLYLLILLTNQLASYNKKNGTASGPSSTYCYTTSIFGLQINESSKRGKYHHHKYSATSKKEIKWIEILLQTPIDDYRKNAIWRILAPYLINTKNLTYKEVI
jgi:3'-phosphoadenosine 5'-phosphosulfate sulfotransferase (PAPS reductase)/FAD synthetase